jgi:hypothetical protein
MLITVSVCLDQQEIEGIGISFFDTSSYSLTQIPSSLSSSWNLALVFDKNSSFISKSSLSLDKTKRRKTIYLV